MFASKGFLAIVVYLLATSAVCPGGLWAADPNPPLVPHQEYPIYDLIVQEKFLTSRTKLVVLQRLTTTHLFPSAEGPPGREFFTDNQFFGRPLDQDLMADFLSKTQRPSFLQPRFNFGVTYRFSRGETLEEPEVSLSPVLVQHRRPMPRPWVPGDMLGILEFSRVGFNRPENQAIVYVGIDRPDATGAGMLIWLHRVSQRWRIADTEVLWVARP